MTNKPELISIKTCPFAQQIAILLLEKKIDFVRTYIDLKNKLPNWYIDISPLCKNPLLRIDGEVLFESSIINEYLDETHLPRMVPENALQRALNRVWVAFGAGLTWNLEHMLSTPDEEQMLSQKNGVKQKLVILEKALSHQPFFNGGMFSLLDVAYIPLFIRLQELENHSLPRFLHDLPKLQTWAHHLIGRKSAQESLPEDFSSDFLKWIYSTNSFFSQKCLSTRK